MQCYLIPKFSWVQPNPSSYLLWFATLIHFYELLFGMFIKCESSKKQCLISMNSEFKTYYFCFQHGIYEDLEVSLELFLACLTDRSCAAILIMTTDFDAV